MAFQCFPAKEQVLYSIPVKKLIFCGVVAKGLVLCGTPVNELVFFWLSCAGTSLTKGLLFEALMV